MVAVHVALRHLERLGGAHCDVGEDLVDDKIEVIAAATSAVTLKRAVVGVGPFAT